MKLQKKLLYVLIYSFVHIFESYALTLSGHIYEDVNGDGDLTDKRPISGVIVRLYETNGTFLSSFTTNASGVYTFNVSPNKNYFVVVDSKSIGSPSGYTTGHSIGEVWAEQTFAPKGGLCDVDADSSTPAVQLTTEGVCFGGQRGDTSDEFNDGNGNYNLSKAEHIAKITVETTDINNIDFGFSFNIVTNVNDKDDDIVNDRTCQGCLRQFIQNANAIVGANTMRFVPVVPLNAGNWWKITLSLNTKTLEITDDNTIVDGTSYDYKDGKSIRDTNPGTIFRTGLSVGTGNDGIPNTGDEHTLPAYEKLELEIDLNNAENGFYITANSTTIRKLSLLHTIDVGGILGDLNGAINFNTGTGCIIEENIIGAHADGSSPNSNLRIYQGVRSDGEDLIVRKNFITDNVYRSLFIFGNAIVEDNYIYNSSTFYECGDSVEIRMDNTAKPAIIQNNWIEKVAAYGVELPQNAGNALIKNNTILNTGNGNELGIFCDRGSSGFEQGAIRITGENNTIVNNIIHNANTSGIIVVNANADAGYYQAKFTKISKNSIYNNGKLSIDIDLSTGQDFPNGDGVSPNDGTINTSQANYGMDYPVFTTVEKNGNKLHVIGFVGTPASKITGTHIIEIYKADDDGNNNGEIIQGDGKSVSHGEGKIYIGTCSTNIDGTFDCNINIPPIVPLNLTDKICGTATDSNNNTSEFSSDYIITSSSILNGYVYEDSNHNSKRDTIESGISNVRVELWYYNGTNWTMESSTTTNGSGYFEFIPANTGTYRIIEDAQNTGTDQNTGSDPSGYISTTPNIVEINWTGNRNQIITFGDYHGSKVSGFVFNDSGNGTTSSTNAHNIIFDSSKEKGIQNTKVKACNDISCSTVIDTTLSKSDGKYTVWIPDSYNGKKVYIIEKDLNDYTSVGDYKETAVDSNTTNSLSDRNILEYQMSSGEIKENYNFADVPKIQITPNHSYLVSSGDSLFISHTINVKTPGEVSILLNSSEGFTYTVYKDYDCDELPDGTNIIPNSGFYTLDFLNTGIYCILIKTVVPTNIPSGTTEKLDVTAYIDWTNTNGINGETGLKYDDSDSVIDTITLNASSEGMLKLEKWVKNVTTSTPYAKHNDAKPCEIIEYKIDFKNIGATNITQITFRDIIPEGTTIINNVYNSSNSDIKVVVENNTYYGKVTETPDTDGAKIENGTLIIDLSKISNNSYETLSPGEKGYFIYRVQLNGNCGSP